MRRTKSLVAKVLVAATIALVVVPAAAGAAPGGNGKGNGKFAVDDGSCTSPRLSGPESVALGDDYVVTGCGFEPGVRVAVTVTEAGGCCYGVSLWADDAGEIAYHDNAWGAGHYKVAAALEHKSGNMRTVAEWSFTAS